MSLRAGELDRRIVVQRAAHATDSFGHEVATWRDMATVPAKVTPVSDSERLRAQEIAASLTHRFVIRWGFGVTVEDRIAYEGRTFEISGVKEIGRRVGQEITAAARGE